VSGVLEVYVNKIKKLSKKAIPNWEPIELDLEIGKNDIEFIYRLQENENTALKAQISKIIITNHTKYGPYECTKCKENQFSSINSSTCKFCEVGTFLENNECKSCPENTTSEENSKQCVLLRDCQQKDYTQTLSDCINGKIEVQYTLKNNTRCNSANWNKTTEVIPCFSCEKGEKLVNSSIKECKLCLDGSYSDISDASECKACPTGTFSERQINIQFDRDLPFYKNKYSISFSSEWFIEDKCLKAVSVLRRKAPAMPL
jgi:hypothetical protein